MSFPEILNTFLSIILEFIIQIYIFYFLIAWKLKKKDKFILRLTLGFIAILAYSLLVTVFYQLYGDTVFGRVLVYTLIYIMTIIHLYNCFDESIWTIIICSALGYALQNLVYKVFLTIWTIIIEYYVIDGIWYRIIYYSIFTIFSILLYRFYLSKLHEKLHNSHFKFKLLIIALSVLLITNILCSFEDVYFANITEIENDFSNYNLYILRQAGNIFSIVCNILAIVLITQTLENDGLKQRVEYLQHTIRASQRQYEISRDTIDLINIKCHDIKYKLEASLNNKEEFESLKEVIAIYDSKIETGNKLLDVLFTEKSLYCEQNNIKFSAMVDGNKLDFIEDGDLYCLFGNLTDNALEAVSKIPDEEKRIVNIVVKVVDNMLIIQQDNYYTGKIKFDDEGLPITSKEDKNYHGFGIQSMKLIVDKYNGTLTTYVNDDVFHLNILFNLKNVQNIRAP
ncbi:MAG: sensor histidine kinase [Acholeplasmatales bacterium]|nr:sensor histidine kinase [Acholeplasmatales bacterium]